MSKHSGHLSPRHTHNDGTEGWDIQVKDENGNVDHKMHVSDQSDVGDDGPGILESVVESVGSVFDSLISGKKDKDD